MIDRHIFSAALALAACATSAPVFAAESPLSGNGQWSTFAVDSFLSGPGVGLGWIDDAGAALTYSFSIGAGMLGTLTVV
ncbi:hypothetical protein NQ353_27370, partial [Escherichia coli]|nr:hypothetical protein [Escherichia coli]